MGKKEALNFSFNGHAGCPSLSLLLISMNYDAINSLNSMASSMSPTDTPSRRICGTTKDNTSKVTSSLGIQIRKKAPVDGISKWNDIDQVIKDSIIQGILGTFDIEGYDTNKKFTEIINAKCQHRYRGWRCRTRRYYDELLAIGKDPYAHCFPSMDDTKCRYMIEHVWNTESFQAKEDEVQPKFSDFFKLSHQSKKKEGGWIDQRSEDEYLALKQLENDSSINGEEFISPEELSRLFFGKKNYLKGLGATIRPSARIKLNGVSSRHDSDELQALNTEVEMLRNVSQEYEEKLGSRAAKISLQNDEIETLEKNMEDMANRQMRFMGFLLSGGSLGDVSLSTGNNLTYKDLIA